MVRPHQHGLCQSVSQLQTSSPSLFVSSSASSSLPSILHSPSLWLLWHCLAKVHQVRGFLVGDLLNYACHTVLHKRRGSSASAACRELGLSTLASRRKLHLALTMFKCMSSNSPPYLSQFFPLPSSHYNTHSASSCQRNLPPNRSSFWPKVIQFHGCSTVVIPATEHLGHQRLQ